MRLHIPLCCVPPLVNLDFRRLLRVPLPRRDGHSASIDCILVSITATAAASTTASTTVSFTASALVSFAASTFAGLAQRVLVLRPRARAVTILAALATPIVPVLVLPIILMLLPLALWSRPLGWRSCSCVICPLPHQPQSTHP